MSVISSMRAAVHWWLRCGGLDAADYVPAGKVIIEPFKGPRPAPPYLSIQSRGPLQQVSLTGHKVYNDDETISYSQLRTSDFLVQAFGDDALDWLERARLVLDDPGVQEHLEGLKVVINDSGVLTDVSALLDTNHETRFALPITVSCRVGVDGVTFTEATTTSTDTTMEAGEAEGDLVFTVTEP